MGQVFSPPSASFKYVPYHSSWLYLFTSSPLFSSPSSLSPIHTPKYCLSDKPEVRPLDPFKTALQKYPITEMQPVYFLAESFQDAQEKIV